MIAVIDKTTKVLLGLVQADSIENIGDYYDPNIHEAIVSNFPIDLVNLQSLSDLEGNKFYWNGSSWVLQVPS